MRNFVKKFITKNYFIWVIFWFIAGIVVFPFVLLFLLADLFFSIGYDLFKFFKKVWLEFTEWVDVMGRKNYKNMKGDL